MPIDHVQDKLQQQKLNNEQVRLNLSRINEYASNHSSDELIDWLKNWKDSPNLTMTNTLFWTLIAIGMACLFMCIAFGLPFFLYIIPFALIGFAFYKKASNKQRDDLSQQLVFKKLEEKYQIRYNHNHLNFNDQDLLDMFPLFGLGNYSNEIEYTASGTWLIKDKKIPFLLFQYHYVERRTSRDKDGKTTTSYHHYNKWGAFIENIPITGISISTDQKRNSNLGQKWTTSDIQFNKKYTLSGNSEINLARFFTPSRTLLLEDTLAQYSGDFYIHPQQPILCWLFSKNVFARDPKSTDIRDVATLVDLLENISLPEYEHLKQTLIPLLEKLD